MENEKWKMENDCVRFAHDLKSFPKEISQFSIINFPLRYSSLNYNLKNETGSFCFPFRGVLGVD
jgi:hypothetical protein